MFKFEPYLDIVKEPKYRKALTQFRTSSHNLNIETGRHFNITRNERICKNCQSGLIETEYHFFTHMPKIL